MTQSSTVTRGENKIASLNLSSELIDFVNLNTGETTALFAQGVEFGNLNSNHFSALGMNPATTASYSNVLMPVMTEEGETKTLATLNDIPTFLPVSATQSGIVDNTSLQELGGVDKLINGVRIGKGSGNDPENSSFGLSALSSNTTGTANTAIGSEALLSNISANNNTAIGNWALRLNQTSPSNTALGVNALTKLLSGVGFNTAVGASALGDLTTGNQNIAVGASSLRRATTGNFNMAIGNNTLSKLTTTNNNTAIGANAGTGITGANNTAIGFLSNGTSAVSSGSYNTTLGYQSGGQLTTGGGNVLIGSYANNAGTGFSTGNNNIAISSDYWYTGVTTGSNNTLVGNIRGLSANDSNLIILADGSQNVAIRKEADNRLLAPTLTNDLIDSGGAKSLLTKEYLDAHSEGGSQNLDEILDNGNIAIGKFIRLNEDSNLQTNSVDIKFDKTVYRDKQQGTPSTEYDKNSITKFDVVLQDVISDFDFSVGVGNFKLPVKTKGSDYTLATTDDITGGSQNLQQTLDNGSTATRENSYINLLSGPTKSTEIHWSNESDGVTDPAIYSTYSQLDGSITLESGSSLESSNNYSSLLMSPDSMYLRYFKDGNGTLVGFRDPINMDNKLYFPSLPYNSQGYDLATTSDISLQKALNNDSSANVIDNLIDITNTDSETGESTNFYLFPNSIGFSDSRDGKASKISMQDSEIELIQSTNSGSFRTSVTITEPISDSNIKFPAPTVAGNYTLATTKDFKTINGQSIVGTGDISVYDDNVLHKTGNESKDGDLNITGNLGITGTIEITDMDTFPRPPETNIILNKNGDLTATNFIGRSITSFTGQFHSNVTIGTAGYNGSKLEVNGTISTNGINVAAALTESSDVIFNSTPVGSQRTIAGNTIQIAGATGDYFLETFRYNASDYGMQRITFTSTASAGRFFIRTLTAGVWSAWIEKQ
ncbi:hypothetical protein FLA105535_04152 [Flavobacterium bizetiae]|uniref:hypothetical protein n=1 Tax=Flavobacterium bizetiae TaxID=2704140 RepID=UPI0019099025|nr:hypothetical protein [Flavobacterium bizetiae]CAD5344147.1 hypothetical protein FLA105535_04152 [Flavobacterium bizetiae]